MPIIPPAFATFVDVWSRHQYYGALCVAQQTDATVQRLQSQKNTAANIIPFEGLLSHGATYVVRHTCGEMFECIGDQPTHTQKQTHALRMKETG